MMPAAKGALWKFFLVGEKQNGLHTQAHWQGCIEKEHLLGEIVKLDENGNTKLLSESWVEQL